MKQLISPPPRAPTPAWRTVRDALRRVVMVLGVTGMALVAAGPAVGLALPLCVDGAILLVAAAIIRVAGARRLELWLFGTEVLADARFEKGWTLEWRLNGRTYTGRSSFPLLWDNGRARVLIDASNPGRMTPVIREMVTVPDLASPAPAQPSLPMQPRRPNDLVLADARRQLSAAGMTGAIAFVAALVVTPFVLERHRFLAEATPAGAGRVTRRMRGSVEYEIDGATRGFAVGGKSLSGWALGSPVPVYRHRGLVVAGPEVPGMSFGGGLALVGIPVLLTFLVLAKSRSEARRSRELWRRGLEVAGEIISDHEHLGRREVVCRFASPKIRGLVRREFASSRQPLVGRRGEAVVLVDPRQPRRATVLLADEV